MVIVGMRPTSPKVIGREVCLWARGTLGLSMDFVPKRCLNILRREKSKEIKKSMKVGEGGVQHNGPLHKTMN
jgi:hypothetical protein